MLQASVTKHILKFNEPSGTSRGILTEKPSWFLRIWDSENPEIVGIGEISTIPKLSPETDKVVEHQLEQKLRNLNAVNVSDDEQWRNLPALRFGFETALLDLQNGGKHILYQSDFTSGKTGIPINGLVWMGDFETMGRRVQQKIDEGFRCIKLKIGAIDFQQELRLIEFIANNFPEIEIRLDANGAFNPNDALQKLNTISKFPIHSIEQPIRAGQWQQMAQLCKQSPIRIALDEELIGIEDNIDAMLDAIMPQFIILKPSLIGGLKQSERWIKAAENRGIGWWATSALESNFGLNAIAQWVYNHGFNMPQGLGTGKIYSNNIPSPLDMHNAHLWHLATEKWDETKI
ncbi:MAG: o-succinylbenzoate synthase [Salinivirgaceae bacterium]|nr:o-succinylbenzoate synthase [Salinivirgaceae bacterium]